MNKIKVIFFGLGGAGQRHLRILYSYKLKFNLSFFAHRKLKKVETIKKNFSLDKKKLSEKYKDLTLVDNENQAYIKKGYSIISNHTSGHYKTVLKSVKKNMNIFVEKPFFCSLINFKKIKTKLIKNKLKFLVGYQRRFSSSVIMFEKLVKKLKIKKIKIQVNSYVPYWHQYEDYKKMYVCKKNLGGGSLLTECHEIDIILKNFGLPNKIKCKKYYDRKDLDVETRHNMIFFYNSFNVDFKINIFSKKIKRNISLITDNSKYNIDLNNNIISKNNKIIFKRKNIPEIEFRKQFKFFFSNRFNLYESISHTENNLLVFHACLKSDKKNKIIKLVNV